MTAQSQRVLIALAYVVGAAGLVAVMTAAAFAGEMWWGFR